MPTPTQLLLCLWMLGAAVGVARAAFAPGCKEYLRACLDQLPPILDKHELRGIPTNIVELDAICQGFTMGMNCVDNFTSVCLERDQQKWVENTVAGTKVTFHMLCKNKQFRNQYLTHSKCFRMSAVTDGWNHCAGIFVSIVKEELARKTSQPEGRIMELCCARHAFIKCVNGSARLKCGSVSAGFLSRIAETLASVRVESQTCSIVNYSYCGAAASLHAPLASLALLGLAAVLLRPPF